MNPTLPQTLQIAVWLCYFRAVTVLLFGLDGQFIVFPFRGLIHLTLPVLFAVGAYLMANERKRGYLCAVVAAAAPLAARLLLAFGISFSSIDVRAISPFRYDVVGLLFEAALFVLLVHPESRNYERIWFK